MFAEVDRLPVMILASLAVYVLVLRFVLRKHDPKSSRLAVGVVSFVVVVVGMVGAKMAEQAGLPWWIYYGVPAAVTVFVPPLVFRLSRIETVQYLVLAYLSAPFINAAFSFFLGWHDYMPFMHVPYWRDLLHA